MELSCFKLSLWLPLTVQLRLQDKTEIAGKWSDASTSEMCSSVRDTNQCEAYSNATGFVKKSTMQQPHQNLLEKKLMGITGNWNAVTCTRWRKRRGEQSPSGSQTLGDPPGKGSAVSNLQESQGWRPGTAKTMRRAAGQGEPNSLLGWAKTPEPIVRAVVRWLEGAGFGRI